jgi:hypothetical protein
MAQLDIVDISKNAATGLITVECRVIEPGAVGEPQIIGVVERWHVEALDIANNYGGQVEHWLRHVGREMLHRHKLRTAAHDDISRWHGKKMEISGVYAAGSPPALDIKP